MNRSTICIRRCHVPVLLLLHRPVHQSSMTGDWKDISKWGNESTRKFWRISNGNQGNRLAGSDGNQRHAADMGMTLSHVSDLPSGSLVSRGPTCVAAPQVAALTWEVGDILFGGVIHPCGEPIYVFCGLVRRKAMLRDRC